MDSLEEEMSRFEQEVLGVTSSAKPRPLMNNAPTPLMPPSQKTGEAAPRPLFPPTLESASPAPKPLMAPTSSSFVPRQALNKPIRPLMGSGSGPPPPQVLPGGPPPGGPPPGGPPPGGPPPGGPHPGGPPPLGIPPPPTMGHSGPPGGANRFSSFPPPGPGMGPPLGQVPPSFPPAPVHRPPPPPQMHSYPPPTMSLAPTGSATPLNRMAIAQAVAGATGSSGVSAHSLSMGAMGASLLPMPSMPPKKGLVGKVKSDPKKLRVGGGKVWEDHSLDDWDQNDFRIFVGDLGNDVNDDTLARSFSRFSSFLKAKVIRDRYSKKTKGYGFVSFKDPKDFMNAMREMNGKYIGNRPIKLRKSTWKDRQLLVVKKKEKEKKRLGFK